MSKFKDVLEGMNIINKYSDVQEEWLAAQHDEVWLPKSKDISEADIAKLEELGITNDEESDSFHFFT